MPPRLSTTADEGTAFRDALAVAIASRLDQVKTEPLTVAQLAAYFRIGRNSMTSILKRIDGAERCGRWWRLPVLRMPPRYLLERGLIVPVQLAHLDRVA